MEVAAQPGRASEEADVRPGRLLRGAQKMSAVRPGELRVADALRALKALMEDPEDTAQVFRIIEALSGKNALHNANRLGRSASGRRLLRDQPDLLQRLLDRPTLERLPEDSLGRAYLRFLAAEGITVEGLHQASIEGRGLESHQLPPEIEFFRNRMRDTHDLWHVVTGYQGDIVGEAALLAFSFAQVHNIGVGLIAGVALVRGPQRALRREILRGFARGARARWLPAVEWESLLALPLEQVRRQLRVGAAPHYQPVRAREWALRPTKAEQVRPAA
jgi:ubiquinone biosynthesis protein COQ4